MAYSRRSVNAWFMPTGRPPQYRPPKLTPQQRDEIHRVFAERRMENPALRIKDFAWEVCGKYEVSAALIRSLLSD